MCAGAVGGPAGTRSGVGRPCVMTASIGGSSAPQAAPAARSSGCEHGMAASGGSNSPRSTHVAPTVPARPSPAPSLPPVPPTCLLSSDGEDAPTARSGSTSSWLEAPGSPARARDGIGGSLSSVKSTAAATATVVAVVGDSRGGGGGGGGVVVAVASDAVVVVIVGGAGGGVGIGSAAAANTGTAAHSTTALVGDNRLAG